MTGTASAPLTRSTLRGTWAAVLLPVAADNSIDFDRLDAELAALTASPVAGIYTAGTAGEFHAIDEDEFDALSERVARRCCEAGKAFQLGASHMSGDVSLGRIRRSRALSPGAFQIVLPDWCPLSDEEVVRAVEGLAEEADPVPVVLYNPPGAKTRLDPADFASLASRVPALVGLKVAGGDDSWFEQMGRLAPGLPYFVPGHLLASGVRRGATGSYSNVACINPTGATRWFEQMASDPVAAEDLERRINDFFDAHISPLKRAGFADAALDKTLAHIGGWAPVGTRTRWPYSSVDETHAESLRPLARAALPELFEGPG